MRDLEENLNNYINEEISFLTYRERRARYINGFTGSKDRSDITIPLSLIKQHDIQQKVTEDTNPSTSLDLPPQEDQETSTQLIKQISILGLLIIVAATTWFFSGDKPDSKPIPIQSESQPEAVATKENVTTNKNNKFVINFVKRDQWDSNTLSEFISKWRKLPRLTRKQIKQSQSFIRLKNSLRLRILEQKALQNIENKEAKRQENMLVRFASQLMVSIK